jgi:hypothetical protein
LLKFARIFRCGTAPGASMRRRASSALFESAIASLLERVLPKEPSFARARFEPLHLLHREEGIDLRLSLAAMPRKRVAEKCRRPRSAVFKPPAVGSISMKIWS